MALNELIKLHSFLDIASVTDFCYLSEWANQKKATNNNDVSFVFFNKQSCVGELRC